VVGRVCNPSNATGFQGGLLVHVGCGDGRLTAALRADDRWVVHGLDADAKNVDAARGHIRCLGLAGRGVSIDRFDGRRLPLIDNLANLLVAEDLGDVAAKEVMRVLCPGGVAYIKKDGAWTKTVKPRPRNIDDWTHFLHGPDGNAVARDDVVGFPRHIQWIGSPKHSRDHEIATSMDVMVSAGGNLFMRAVPLGPDLAIRDKKYVPHLFGSLGFLEDTGWERMYWIYGVHFYSGARDHGYARTLFPAGRILAYDDQSVYGYQDLTINAKGPSIFRVPKCPDFVDVTEKIKTGPKPRPKPGKAGKGTKLTDAEKERIRQTYVWKKGVPQNPKAMNLTDGQKKTELKFPTSPVFDGMIAGGGRLFLSMKDGSIICLEGN